MTARRAAWLLLLAALAGRPRAAAAGTEEFSTFDVESQEEDDESLIDHLLTRPPRAWRDEWETSTNALRTSQGCLTSGQWFIDTRLKLRAPMGKRARFGFELAQDESDRESFLYTDFTFRFPTGWGTPGALFRPLFDKSRQDFGVFWEAGDDTASAYLLAQFVFEDTFNNLWAFRQTRVGETSEPYVQHPYEPTLAFRVRRPDWRVEALGRWLTPSRKTLSDPDRTSTLWGAFGTGAVEGRALGLGWELRGGSKQAASTEQPLDLSTADSRDVRRQWWVESVVRGRVSSRVETEARWLYQDRTQSVGAPEGPRGLDAIDRVIQAEATIDVVPGWVARVGGLYDNIGVDVSGAAPAFTYGSRTESRAYVGLSARFGSVRVHAVEGMELDPEPYEVWAIHDKAFLHLQTTF